MIALDGVSQTIGDKEYRLRFTWAALLSLENTFAGECEKRVAEAILERKIADLAVIIEATGGPQAEDVIAASPPIRQVCLSLEVAWAWAFNGYEAAEHFAAARAREEKENAAQLKGPAPKKSIRSLFASVFNMLSRTRSAAT